MNQTTVQNQTQMFSEFKVTLVDKDSLRAVASCKVGEAIWLHGMRVVEGTKGRFVSMPSRKAANGEYQDIFYPASREVREQLQSGVLAKYNETVRAAAQDRVAA